MKSDNGYRGLCESQLKVLAFASSPFLLLEDDALIVDFERYLSIPADADALYLGTSNWALSGRSTTHNLKFNRSDIPGILRIRNMLSAHAILFISDEFTKSSSLKLKENLESNTEISDVVFARLQKKYRVYCRNNPMFIQDTFSDSLSDATNWTDKALTDYPRTYAFLGKSIPLNIPAMKKLFIKRTVGITK